MHARLTLISRKNCVKPFFVRLTLISIKNVRLTLVSKKKLKPPDPPTLPELT